MHFYISDYVYVGINISIKSHLEPRPFSPVFNLLSITVKLLLTLNSWVDIIVSQFSLFSYVLFLFPLFSLRPDKLASDWSRPFSIKSPVFSLVFSSLFSSVFKLSFSLISAWFQFRFQLSFTLVSARKFSIKSQVFENCTSKRRRLATAAA